MASAFELKSESGVKIPSEIIEVFSNSNLLLRTNLTRNGKTIIFRPVESYKGFCNEISICFPPCSVLGEENICLEVMPEDMIQSYNEKFRKQKKIITPVVHIDRQNGASFLRNVTVTLPLVRGAEKWLANGIKMSPPRMKYSEKTYTITIQTNKFSPAGVEYCEVEKILDAVGLNDHFSLNYKELGIYLMVEQSVRSNTNGTHIKFDLRKFRNRQEHQRYRMDKTKSFCLLLNPQRVKKADGKKKIRVTVEGNLKIQNVRRTQHIQGNEILFHYPKPNLDVDDCNERFVQFEDTREPGINFNLAIQYNSKNMENLAKSRINDFTILTRTEIEDIKETFEMPDHQMLVEFLGLLKDKWTVMLSNHLHLNISGLHEFITADIKDTIRPVKNLNLTANTIMNLRKEGKSRGYDDNIFSGVTAPLLVDSIMRNFRKNSDLRRAKLEIISMFKASGIISEQDCNSESLGLRSRESLATALMYIPIRKLRDAMICVCDDEMKKEFTKEMTHFLVYPDGEALASSAHQ